MHTSLGALTVDVFGRMNEMYGVALRFKVGALYATRPWVLIMDDDILPSESSIETLIETFAANPDRIVGKWCENPP